jgi:hypothetical protein
MPGCECVIARPDRQSDEVPSSGQPHLELATNRKQLLAIVEDIAPGITRRYGVGPVSAAQAVVSFPHPGRCHNEAAFAALSGTSPIPASSGRTIRHQLNRGGDRALNRAIHGRRTGRDGRRPRPSDRYVTIVEFPSYEAAMENSRKPETGRVRQADGRAGYEGARVLQPGRPDDEPVSGIRSNTGGSTRPPAH